MLELEDFLQDVSHGPIKVIRRLYDDLKVDAFLKNLCHTQYEMHLFMMQVHGLVASEYGFLFSASG